MNPEGLSKYPSHWANLVAALSDGRSLYSGGIPVETIPRQGDRTNNSAIISEGKGFSGIVVEGCAEAFCTPNASPHILPTVDLREFISKAKAVFGRKSRVSESFLQNGQLSNHLIVWWKRNGEEGLGSYGLGRLSRLKDIVPYDFFDAIAAQTTKCFDLVKKLGGKPMVYGMFGYTEEEVRKKSGFTRGAPSIAAGHLHVTAEPNPDRAVGAGNRLSASEELKHLHPWDSLLFERFGRQTVEVLTKIVTTQPENRGSVVRLVDVRGKTGQIPDFRQGYQIVFAERQTLEGVLATLTGVIGECDSFYQDILDLYGNYYRSIGNEQERNAALDRMVARSQKFGFDEKTSGQIADFITTIRPTYGQLEVWESELQGGNSLSVIQKMKARYKKLQATTIKKDGGATPARQLVYDTTKDSESDSASTTFTGHFSGTWIINRGCGLDKEYESLYADSVYLFPSFASSKSVEKMHGTVLRR
jgi:hypothetical protein